MRPFERLLLTGLLLFAGNISFLHAQSDRQTLRSPQACFTNMTDLDLGISIRDGLKYPLSLGLQTTLAYQFNQRFTLGIGAGLHTYGPGDMLLLPIFVDWRMHFPQRNWTPYLVLDGGYSISLTPDTKGGVLINPAVGGRFPIADNAAVSLSLGYRWQQNQAEVAGTPEQFRPEYLSVKLGLVTRFPRLTYKIFSKTLKRMKEKTPNPR